MDIYEESLNKHREWQGKIEVVSRVRIADRSALSLAYTPGVAAPCLAIKENPDESFRLTRRSNLVAVITDGTAVLGLGDIGPEAGMPVMEGKCALFKEFAGIDAFPICVRSKDVGEIVRAVSLIAGSFGGINLEDISAPRCFEVESRLKELCDIPVFHDDQHGTAVVVGAALINALKVVGKDIKTASVVINGAGAAGSSICRHLLALGVSDIVVCDKYGVLRAGDPSLSPAHASLAEITNKKRASGSLSDAVRGADVFIGVSAPGVLTADMVKSMAPGAVVFAMANPTPEIMPDEALRAGAAVVGTGRSDYPNQINNVLAFPGIFRGALDTRARCINEDMKIAATLALASYIPDPELGRENIIPSPLDKNVVPAVAKSVSVAAVRTGAARTAPAGSPGGI